MDAKALLAWFDRSARRLPWRDRPAGAREAYRTWVSEVMLQQTRVETVLRYYAPFLAAFPDVASLARAPEDALMKRWEGLGYYRRARLLHEGARALVARDGAFPRTARELEELPGFGPYTAGAVASLAFNERAAAVDGNVLRVWARQTGFDGDIKTPGARRDAAAWVLAYQPARAAGAYNEALIELGATVCAARSPACAACPVRASCTTRSDALPVTAPKRTVRAVRVALALARRADGRVLLEKRASGLLAGTWGLPWVEGGPEELREHVARLSGGEVTIGRVAARGRHAFTHRTWEMRAFEVATTGRAGAWRRPSDVALGTAHRNLLAAASAGAAERAHGARGRGGRGRLGDERLDHQEPADARREEPEHDPRDRHRVPRP